MEASQYYFSQAVTALDPVGSPAIYLSIVIVLCLLASFISYGLIPENPPNRVFSDFVAFCFCPAQNDSLRPFF